MKPAHFALWAAFVIVAGAFLILLLSGCTAEKKVESAKLSVQALDCRGRMSDIIQASHSCGVAAAGIRQIIKEDPVCLDIFLRSDIELRCDGGLQ